eukprot:GFKZ01011418.1.p1 GENE.GFKZ01011418.1~~GFKZ01011418.1.p1  ORF type:complete len:309 (+),score=13.15 GFKZ01011418.1:168-1094(+)
MPRPGCAQPDTCLSQFPNPPLAMSTSCTSLSIFPHSTSTYTFAPIYLKRTSAALPPHLLMPAKLKLSDFPHDLLLVISDFLNPAGLHSLSLSTPFFSHFILNHAWPRRIAKTLGVRSLNSIPPTSPLPRVATTYQPSDSHSWHRFFTTLSSCPSSRTLSVCVRLEPQHSITSLALQYSVSRQDIFRMNALYSEHHAASRTHLYIPLPTESLVRRFTGLHTSQHSPLLIRDNLLSKCFLVVKFCIPTTPLPEMQTLQSKRESYVRQLVVKLIAKGFAVEPHEVRFYLEDNDFDVARAYKQLLADHQFCP